MEDPNTKPWSPNGHQMVMNDLLPPPLFNVNRPSDSKIQLFQNLTIKILVKAMRAVKGHI